MWTQETLGQSGVLTGDEGRGRYRVAGLAHVLRGLAALAVVFDHASYYVLHHVRTLVYQWFDPGNYGVFVFFIISGYIVPASLERKGSVRTFWVSRLFRLYPLYLLAVGLAVALYFAHFGSIRGEDSDPETSILSQPLMMSTRWLDTRRTWSGRCPTRWSSTCCSPPFIARVHKRSSCTRWASRPPLSPSAACCRGLLHQQRGHPAADRARGRPGGDGRPGPRGRAARHVTAGPRGHRRGGAITPPAFTAAGSGPGRRCRSWP